MFFLTNISTTMRGRGERYEGIRICKVNLGVRVRHISRRQLPLDL